MTAVPPEREWKTARILQLSEAIQAAAHAGELHKSDAYGWSSEMHEHVKWMMVNGRPFDCAGMMENILYRGKGQ